MRRTFTTSFISILTLLISAAGGAGCSDSNAAGRVGTGIAGSGSGGGGGGGGAGTGGSAMINCGDTSQPIDPTALIDDMEAPDYQAARAGMRTGSWWAGGDMASPGAGIQPDGNADAELIPGGGRCGSKYAMHVTGHGYSQWAVLSVSMGWGSVDGGADGLLPNDNDFRTGVTFWARIGDTSSNQVRFAITDKYSRPEGGICVDPPQHMGVDCYDTFGVDLTGLETGWHQYRIPFGGLTQRNFGLQRPKLDAASIYTIEFNFNPTSVFDFWVDDISFY